MNGQRNTQDMYRNIARQDVTNNSYGTPSKPNQSLGNGVRTGGRADIPMQAKARTDQINGVKFGQAQKVPAGGQGSQAGFPPPFPVSPPATAPQFNPMFMQNMNPNGGFVGTSTPGSFMPQPQTGYVNAGQVPTGPVASRKALGGGGFQPGRIPMAPAVRPMPAPMPVNPGLQPMQRIDQMNMPIMRNPYTGY